MIRPSHSSSLSAAALCALLLGGCATQTPQPRPSEFIPDRWQNADVAAEAGSTRVETQTWWRQFDSAELNRLMELALHNNLDLAASVQRIEQARARLTASRATLFPQLSAGYTATGSSQWDADDNRSSGESDRANLNASYEVDLWGQLRAANAATAAALAASEFGHRTLELSLQAQVASTYFQYLAARDRLQFAEQSLDNSQQLLRLVELQFQEGSASRLELVQQQNSVVVQQAQINSLRNSLQQVRYALDLLLGQKPGELELQGTSLAQVDLPSIAPGQPSELLYRRPDLLQAEAGLAAAQANVAVARAAFFPSLRITAGASASELLLGDPISKATSIAAGLTAPLFDAGRNRAEYRSSLAAQEEALLNYYQTVLQAAGEVQSSLADVELLSQNLELQAQRLALSEETRALAELRYKEGSADFITLLDAERSLIAAQDTFVQATLERHLEAVELYRALGGSWQGE